MSLFSPFQKRLLIGSGIFVFAMQHWEVKQKDDTIRRLEAENALLRWKSKARRELIKAGDEKVKAQHFVRLYAYVDAVMADPRMRVRDKLRGIRDEIAWSKPELYDDDALHRLSEKEL
ncbi:hypothetical protein BJ508DRAFT_332593 [Ascobolus immersus RN42]|uniref:Uncharacterized protein n=1 Tax=Ascobolus immersus RN42 TaxID=1160509 RepID=A0A3N4HM86_ASCIM|nr:hypothetical protein BJ508DRAFT_332593 [Ascobolus immersus RN42]